MLLDNGRTKSTAAKIEIYSSVLNFVDLDVTDDVMGHVKVKNIDICDMFTFRWLTAHSQMSIDYIFADLFANVYLLKAL